MELLIRIVDKGIGEPEKDRGIKFSKAGDVIAACPDGWGWSKLEIENPDWRVVRVNLSQLEAESLLSAGDGDMQLMPIDFHRYFIDLDKLPVGVKQEVIDTPYDIVDLTQYVREFRKAATIRGDIWQ